MKNLIIVFALLISTPAYSADFTNKNTQSKYLAEGQIFIKKRAKDPSSVKFRNSRFNLANINGKTFPAVCGEINSKNSYGAYTGFQRFVSVPPAISATEEESADFSNIWEMMCN